MDLTDDVMSDRSEGSASITHSLTPTEMRLPGKLVKHTIRRGRPYRTVCYLLIPGLVALHFCVKDYFSMSTSNIASSIFNSGSVIHSTKDSGSIDKPITNDHIDVEMDLLTSADPSSPQPDSKCGYLVRTFFDGRLGNQMFGYASFYGMVRAYGNKANKLTFFNNGDALDAFERLSLPRITLLASESWYEEQNFTQLDEHQGCCTYDDSGLAKLACDGKNVIIGGWRQSFKYFIDYADEIKEEFAFKSSIREECLETFGRRLADVGMNQNCVTVGVHLRRGDFVGDTPFIAAREAYVKKAISFYESKVFGDGSSSVKNDDACLAFLIFGDNYAWNAMVTRKLQLLKPKRTRIILIDAGASSAEVDMCMMRLCDHMAISSGTFSWWAGFFSPGVVTRQKEYANIKKLIYRETTVEDYFPPNWIPL